MSFRDRRRRARQALAAHDWLEGVSVALGLVFFLVALAATVGFGVAVSTLGDPEPELARANEALLRGSTEGTLNVTRGFALVLFAVAALLAAAVGWFLAGDAVRRAMRRVRGRGTAAPG